MFTNLTEGFAGWTAAHFPAHWEMHEAEYRQGKNAYLVAIAQVGQLFCAQSLFTRLLTAIPAGPAYAAISLGGEVLGYTALAIIPLAACVLKGRIRENRLLTKKVCHIVSKYGGTLIRTASIVTTIALCYFGSPYYAFGFLIRTAYSIGDQKGMIPKKISEFMRLYFNNLVLAISIPRSGWFFGILSIQVIGQTLCPSLLSFCCQRIEVLVRTLLFMKGNAIADYMAPLRQKEMTYNEIREFFEHCKDLSEEAFQAVFKGEGDYEVNPAHCSKSALPPLETSSDFDSLLTYFESIDWQLQADRIKNKLYSDDRFRSFIGKQLHTCLSEPLRSDSELSSMTVLVLDEHVQRLAGHAGLAPEEYRFRWFRRQVEKFVLGLQPEKRREGQPSDPALSKMEKFNQPLLGPRVVKGAARDLEEAIKNTSNIVPYLRELHATREALRDKENLSQADQILLKKVTLLLEDALLKLTVEAGGYCALGLKGPTAEQVKGIIQQKLAITEGQKGDDVAVYERQVRSGLELFREEVAKEDYRHPMQDLIANFNCLREAVADRHVEDLANMDVKMKNQMGFVALAPGAEDKVGLLELYYSLATNFVSIEMYKAYCKRMYGRLIFNRTVSLANFRRQHPNDNEGYAQLAAHPQGILTKIGLVHFFSYIHSTIQQNSQLSDQEKDRLQQYITDRWGEADPRIERALHLYMLVKIGILRKKQPKPRLLKRLSLFTASLQNRVTSLFQRPVGANP